VLTGIAGYWKKEEINTNYFTSLFSVLGYLFLFISYKVLFLFIYGFIPVW